jgi:exopolysaccharide biosynthesis polyprenyl glycosylphosphotransferase
MINQNSLVLKIFISNIFSFIEKEKKFFIKNIKNFFIKNWSFLLPFILFFSDLLFFNLSLFTAIYLRFGFDYDYLLYIYPCIFANISFIVFSTGFGLYRGIFKASLERQKSQIGKICMYMFFSVMSYLYLIKGSDYSRGVMIIFIMTMYVSLEFVHSIFNRINSYLVRKGMGNKNVLIIGIDYSAKSFAEKLEDIYGDFYKIKGFISNSQNGIESKVEAVLGTSEKLDYFINIHKIQQIFIVSDSMDINKYTSVRKTCEKYNVYLKMVSPNIRNLMKKKNIKDITGVPLTTDFSRKHYYYVKNIVKRIIDLLVIVAGGIIILPLCLFVALIIKLTSKGPVFFKQKRSLYKGGKEFLCYKFRTMYEDAEERKKEVLKNNETDGALFKIKGDPRITSVGQIIRKFSMDEFPQFINVLKGEMSIVGPRPLPVKDFELLNNDKICYDWYKKRGEVKPGITGLWQVTGRSNLTFEEMCLLDLYYIENQSVFFDLEIMFETFSVMFFGKGAY